MVAKGRNAGPVKGNYSAMTYVASRSPNEGEDWTIPSSGRYMVGKLGPKSTQFARGLVKSVPWRPVREVSFRAVPPP